MLSLVSSLDLSTQPNDLKQTALTLAELNRKCYLGNHVQRFTTLMTALFLLNLLGIINFFRIVELPRNYEDLNKPVGFA